MNYADPTYFRHIGVNIDSVISFAGGWVNHSAPEELQRSYEEIVKDRHLFHKSGGYSPTLGMQECREAIVDYEKHLYAMDDVTSSNIAIGANSTQLTFDILKVLLDPGDKILLLDPSYCNFPTQIITALNVNIIRFPVIDTDSWKYIADEKAEEFAQFILTEKPKVILLVSPDNPTSQILSDTFIRAALDSAKEVGSFLVIDFAYKDIVFSEDLPKYYSWAPTDNFLSIHSSSKSIRNLGRRLGWIEANEDIIESLESIQSSSILCPDTLHQMAFTKFITTAINENTLKLYVKKVSEQYRKAALCTVHAVKEHLQFPCFIPQGGLYTCMNVGMDGARFVEDVLKNTGVLFVPGWGFGRTLQNSVRISYGPLVNDLNMITEAVRRVGVYLMKQQNNLTIKS
jgi:aspartate/methionine/tyrosine aminotransferase